MQTLMILAIVLISFMQSTMPPGGATLPGDTYLNLAAFILDANSARRQPGAHGRLTQGRSNALKTFA